MGSLCPQQLSLCFFSAKLSYFYRPIFTKPPSWSKFVFLHLPIATHFSESHLIHQSHDRPHYYSILQTHPQQWQTSKKKIPTPNLKNPPANFTNLESQIASPNGFDPFDPTTTMISFEIHFLLRQSINHVESFNPATPKTTLSKERPKPSHCKTHPRKPTHNKPSILTTHNRRMKLGFSMNWLVCKNGFWWGFGSVIYVWCFGGWLYSDVDIGFLGDWLWTCGYGGVTESTESPPASSSLSFLFIIFSIILIKLSFSLLLFGCKRNCAFMI